MQLLTVLSLALSLLPTLSLAHFKISYPGPRGPAEDTQVQYPCAGLRVNNDRTMYPLTMAPLMIDDEHTSANVGAVIALGNNPTGADFTTQLVPTISTRGPQDFCFGAVNVLAALQAAGMSNATMESLNGMNATISVSTATAAEGGEGLYNCADITLTTTPLSSAEYTDNCKNSTGVRSMMLANGNTMNPNGSTVGGDGTTSSSSSGGSSSANSSSSDSSNAAATVPISTALALGLAALGVAALDLL